MSQPSTPTTTPWLHGRWLSAGHSIFGFHKAVTCLHGQSVPTVAFMYLYACLLFVLQTDSWESKVWEIPTTLYFQHCSRRKKKEEERLFARCKRWLSFPTCICNCRPCSQSATMVPGFILRDLADTVIPSAKALRSNDCDSSLHFLLFLKYGGGIQTRGYWLQCEAGTCTSTIINDRDCREPLQNGAILSAYGKMTLL